ncbi:hypothetical protein UFOVP119_74 [uncultured Caudovirales phage]|uniref:Uncharacterized protein n=1 Tax=uncultured Caudovirales phage TaxID=2100421 RepID=A0A6J5LBY8_9CAUD|nr:hypothetical protein UFOVP119_74 [uncultured Caudovirales phage]
MSFDNISDDTVTLAAAADLSTKQYYAVKVDSSGNAAVAGAGDFAAGLLQNKPSAAGQPATVAYGGVSKGFAGGTITAGNLVAADASGKLVAATKGKTDTSDTGAAADALIGSNVIGIALASAVASDIFPVLLLIAGAVPTTAA